MAQLATARAVSLLLPRVTLITQRRDRLGHFAAFGFDQVQQLLGRAETT